MSIKSIKNGVESVIPIPAPGIQVLDLNNNYENNDLENILKEVKVNHNSNSNKIGVLSELETNYKDNLVGAINENVASLSENVQQIKAESSGKYYQPTEFKVRKNQYQYYQTLVTNPNNFAITNRAVGIYIDFEEKECLGEDYIKVTDSNGNSIPFQWEGDKDQKTLSNIGTYSDGSLKFGTLWILANFTANEVKTYTITIYDTSQNNSFTQNVTHNVVTADSIENIKTGTVTMTFQSSINWLWRKLLLDTTDFNSAVSACFGAINKSDYSQINASDGTLLTPVSHMCTGSGVIYMDWETKATYNYNSNVSLVHKYRLFANGTIEVDCRHYITGNVTEGTISGVLNKIDFQNVLGTYEYDSSKYFYATQENTTYQILAGVRDIQNKYELDDSRGYDWSLSCVTNTTDQKVISGWLMASPNTRTTANGSMWSSRYYISTNYGQGNKDTEIQIMQNRIYSRATKQSKFALRRKFINMSKEFLETMREWDILHGTSYFYGLQGLESYGAYKICSGNINLIEEARTKLYQSLSRFYDNGSVSGFYNAWYDTSRGIEFTGRDIRVASYLRKEYLALGDTTNAEDMTRIVHNLADAFVQMEVTSGGNGYVFLRYGTLDNFNAEAGAMLALADSLAIEENATRRATLDRIVARFESGFWWGTKLPYDQNNSSDYRLLLKNPAFHYHAFSMFDYYHANDICDFGTTMKNYNQYCFESTTPSGQAREIGTQYNPARRGSPLTLIYVAGLFIMQGWENRNISEMEHACILLEHILSRKLPYGFYEYPMDGWNYDIGEPATIAAVMSQVVIEAILNME